MREYLTSKLLCPTSNVTEPIPTGFGQQGQECPKQLLSDTLGVSACACSTSDGAALYLKDHRARAGPTPRGKRGKTNRMQCCRKH